jgi:hypothetical protein
MTEQLSDPAILPYGSLARITRKTRLGEDSFREGTKVEIEDYVDAEDAEDNIPFYWVMHQDSNRVVRASDVELAKSPEEMRARTIPTKKDIVRFLASTIVDDAATFEIDETQIENEGKLEVYGKTHDGLRFSFELKIKNIQQTDF